MTADQKIELDSSYQPSVAGTDANPRIRSVVLDICARYGATRILGIGRGAQALHHDLHHAGYTIASMEVIESGDAHPIGLAPVDQSCPPVIAPDSSPMNAASFDMAISIDPSDSCSRPSTLVKLAAINLQSNGVLILSMPYGRYMKNLLITVRERLSLPLSASWDGGYIQRWSQKSLTALFRSQGFTIVELTGVRDASLRWDALILVARKTGRVAEQIKT